MTSAPIVVIKSNELHFWVHEANLAIPVQVAPVDVTISLVEMVHHVLVDVGS
jgi:hypothetical protein